MRNNAKRGSSLSSARVKKKKKKKFQTKLSTFRRFPSTRLNLEPKSSTLHSLAFRPKETDRRRSCWKGGEGGRCESNLANSRLNGRSLGGGTLVRGWGANTRLLNNAARRPVSGNNRRGNYRRSIEKNLAWIIISPLARSLGGRRGREDDDEWKSGFTGRWMKMWGEEGRGERRRKRTKKTAYGEREEGEVELGRGKKRRGLMVWTRLEERGRVGWSKFSTANRRQILHFYKTAAPPHPPSSSLLFLPPKAVKLGRRVNDDEIIARCL